MKLQRLGESLSACARDIARELAFSESCHISALQYANLTLTPDDMDAVRHLLPRLTKQQLYHSVDVTLPGSRRIRFSPVSLKEAFALEDCDSVQTANPELIERIAGWYDRRLTLGHLGKAFETYCAVLINHSDTVAHLYRAFNNITTVFARCGRMTQEDINEAMRANPRTVAVIPQKYKALREAATQAAVLVELLDDGTSKKNKPSMAGNYELDLPARRDHLKKLYALERFPLLSENTIELQPL